MADMGQIVFIVLAGLWLLLEAYLHLFFNRRTAGMNSEKISKHIMLVLFMVGLMGGRIFFPDFAPAFREPFNPVRWAGLLLILASLVPRLAVIRQLGGSYSINPGVAEKQRLVTAGCFRYVRHPGHLSMIINFLGIALCYWHAFASPLAFLLPTAAVAYRIRIEEQVLVRGFGNAYEEYRARTKMLIPRML